MMHLVKTDQQARAKIYQSGDGYFSVLLQARKHDKHNPQDVMHQWVKEGYVPRFLDTTIHVVTSYVDFEGNCYSYFNPQQKQASDKPQGRSIINFRWVLEATPENAKRILDECERRYRNYIR